MTFAFSAETRQIAVNHYDASTGEFLQTTTDTIPPHTGLPASSTDVELPTAQDGYARVFNGSAWVQVQDNRGTTVYLKSTRQAILVGTLGTLLDTVTTTAPATAYDVWNATTGAWETDAAAQLAAEVEALQQEWEGLMATANQQVEIWTDATAQSDTIATDALMLAAWKAYRVQLIRLDLTDPANVVWPTVPTAAAVTAAAAATESSTDTTSSDETASTDTSAQE